MLRIHPSVKLDLFLNGAKCKFIRVNNWASVNIRQFFHFVQVSKIGTYRIWQPCQLQARLNTHCKFGCIFLGPVMRVNKAATCFTKLSVGQSWACLSSAGLPPSGCSG